MPCRGWNSAAVPAGGMIGMEPVGLPLPIAVSVAPTVPWPPPEQPATTKVVARTAVASSLALVRRSISLTEMPPSDIGRRGGVLASACSSRRLEYA